MKIWYYKDGIYIYKMYKSQHSSFQDIILFNKAP
jgi:hypothetical protein